MRKLRLTVDDERVQVLCQNDEKLCSLIHVIGDYSIELQENYFETIIEKMIGQLLSVQAADAIRKRVRDLCPDMTPASLSLTQDQDLRAAGLSTAKISYIRDFIDKVNNGSLCLERLPHQSDEEVMRELTQVKGIGVWTAQMFLIFSLGRLNILPAADIGLQRGIRWLYQQKAENIDFEFIYKKWSPYCTIATLYMWELVNRKYEKQYSDMEALAKFP